MSNRLRKSNLRKVKTDAADAYLLAELYYKEEFEPESYLRGHSSISKTLITTSSGKYFW
ncbi:hypothetical protein [Paenibacillus wynnii]|uniref:hypothetical protein n=1 Tax=Paenibacillus wynnii TaxID=268407 RepID=UPI0027D90505|nr:hypothetical protein [Paenibacillus wynnii]